MNRERIQQLIDLFETLPDEKVDMTVFQRDGDNDHVALLSEDALRHCCGTAACIAGWSAAIWPDTTDNALDLGADDWTELCLPERWDRDGFYTRTDAIATLKHLLETGEVRWPEKEQ